MVTTRGVYISYFKKIKHFMINQLKQQQQNGIILFINYFEIYSD